MSDAWPAHIGLGSFTEEDIARRCGELLNDPILAAVMNELDADALLTWRRSSSPAQREDCWHRCSVIADMRLRLEKAIENLRLDRDRTRRRSVPRD